MLKILRKYNKIILVVGGSFLMVVFLLPQAAQQFGPNPRNQVFFYADGQAFRGEAMRRAQNEVRALEVMQQAAPMVPLFPAIASIDHWILLTHEAERLGMVGGGGDRMRLFDALATRMALTARPAPGETPEQAGTRARQETIAALEQGRADAINALTADPAFVDEALAKLQGVNRLAATLAGFTEISTQEAALYGLDLFDTAVADLGVIYAADLPLDDLPNPTEAEMLEHFGLYKDSLGDDNEHGFGYRQPNAVKLEALEINATAIRNAVTLDPVDVNRYWRQNQERFGSDFAASRTSVETAMRTDRVEEIMRSAKEAVRRELIKARLDLDRDGQLFVVPEDWAERRPTFERLAEAAQIEIDRAVGAETSAVSVQEKPGEWLDIDAVSSLPVGRTSVASVLGALRFPAFVMAVHELNPDAQLGLQQGITYGPVDSVSQSYYVRVDDVRPAGPPESLDDVRDQVRDDLLVQARYERLRDRAEELRTSIAASGGLSSLYDEFEDLYAQVGIEVTRTSMRSPDGAMGTMLRGNTEEVRGAIADTVSGWGFLEDVASMPADDRTLYAEIPGEHALVLALIKNRQPLTREKLREGDSRVIFRARTELTPTDTVTGVGGPLSFESISGRLGYREAERRRGEEEDEEELLEEETAEG